MTAEDRIIVTIDTPNFKEAIERVRMMLPIASTFKLGQLIYSSRHFWSVVDYIKDNNKKIFLDLKLWDIPKTVFRTIENLPPTIDYVTIKWDALSEDQVTSLYKIKPLAVVHLSSNGNRIEGNRAWNDFNASNYNGFTHAIVSPEFLVGFSRPKLRKIVPGIRLETQKRNDHVMTLTPQEAIANGADQIILGSALFDAGDPLVIATKIWESLSDTGN